MFRMRNIRSRGIGQAPPAHVAGQMTPVSGSAGHNPRGGSLVSIRRFTHGMLAVALACASLQLAPVTAEAQCTTPSPTCSHVTPDAKGIIGLGLIGAEIGFIVPALVQDAMHTNEWWPYLVFPALGAVGGAIGGWGVEQATAGQPEADVALLAIGMALIVPTMVATLALTAYDPNDVAQQAETPEEEEYSEPDLSDETTTEAVQVEDTGEFPAEETAPSQGGGAEGGGEGQPSSTDGGGASLRRRMDTILAGGPGLLRFDGSRILLGVPMVRRLATFTAEEQRSLQLAPASDVNIPVVSGTF